MRAFLLYKCQNLKCKKPSQLTALWQFSKLPLTPPHANAALGPTSSKCSGCNQTVKFLRVTDVQP